MHIRSVPIADIPRTFLTSAVEPSYHRAGVTAHDPKSTFMAPRGRIAAAACRISNRSDLNGCGIVIVANATDRENADLTCCTASPISLVQRLFELLPWHWKNRCDQATAA